MADGFVIMQIGNKKLDRIYNDVYQSVIKELGYDPIRVDIQNDGTLIKLQIIRYLRDAELIIADLTNERPNCYLEVGIAMGLNRYDRLFLCCREDHNPDIRHAKRYRSRKKVHFDLSGYGIIWWDQNNVDDFKKKLRTEIKQRMSIVKQRRQSKQLKGHQKRNIDAWINSRRQEAAKWIKK